MRSHFLGWALTAAGLALAAGEALAREVTIEYEVRVTEVADPLGDLAGEGIEVSVDDTYVGRYTYDTATSPHLFGTWTVYTSVGVPYGMSVSLGAMDWSCDMVSVQLMNDGPPWWVSDRYQVSPGAYIALPSGRRVTFGFFLDNSGAWPALPGNLDTSLPAGAPQLAHWRLRSAWVAFRTPDGGSYPAILGEVVRIDVVPPVEVALDIRPGTLQNVINQGSRGKLPVAILGSADLDVGDVDVASVRFGGAAVARKPNGELHASVEDVDGDGHDDLVLHFDIQDLRFHKGATEGTLTGRLLDGTPIHGVDSLQITS